MKKSVIFLVVFVFVINTVNAMQFELADIIKEARKLEKTKVIQNNEKKVVISDNGKEEQSICEKIIPEDLCKKNEE